MSQNLTLPEKVVELIRCSSAGLEKAAAAEDANAAQRTKIAAMIPTVVDALVANGRINPEQREKAAAVLQDPVQTLELLGKVAAHRNPDEQPLGQSTKTAGHNKQANGRSSVDSPFVGRRSVGPKDSDFALFRGLGLAAPAS